MQVAAGDSGRNHHPEPAGRAPDALGLVVSALFFFPRGGSAQVTRSLARALPAAGWQPTLAAGSLGQPGEPTHAASFFAGIHVHALDYSPSLELAEPLAAPVPFQPSYEDRPDAPDRIFAAVDDAAYERLVAAWIELLAHARAGPADLLHLHHLTPANEAAARGFPSLPVLGQLHGTELAMLRTIQAGAPPGWRPALPLRRPLHGGKAPAAPDQRPRACGGAARQACAARARRRPSGRVGGRASARHGAWDREPAGLPRRLAPARGASPGAERGRRARPALRRRGVRARPRRGDGLRPTGDRLPRAWPGGDRRRRKDGLAHSARRRGRARRLAPRGR